MTPTDGWADDARLTAGLSEITLGFVVAREALLDARHAERNGDFRGASLGFGRAVAGADGTAEGWPGRGVTRAGALAGQGRVDDDAEARRAAAAAFEELASGDLGADELADWASVLEPGDVRAHELYAAATRAGGAPPLAHLAVGIRAVEAGDAKAAIRDLERAVLGAPRSATMHAALGHALSLVGQSASAASACTTAAVLEGGYGDHETALLYAERALALDPENVLALLVRGDLLRVAGALDSAATCLRGVVAGMAGPPDAAVVATRALARALERGGRRQDAVDALASLVEHGDADAEDRLLLGHVEVALGNSERAEVAYRSAVLADPFRVDTVYALVRYHLRQNRLDDARHVVDDALERNPRHPQLYVLRGELRSRAGEGGAPDEDIERAQLLGLEGGHAWKAISDVRVDTGDRAGALDALERALRLRPDDAQWHARRGELALDLGDIDLAVRELEDAARLDGSDPEIHLRLAEARLGAGDGERALVAVDAAMELAEELSAHLLGVRGQVTLALGDRETAIRDLRASVEKDPTLGWPAAELLSSLAETDGIEAAADQVVGLLARFGDAGAVAATAAALRGERRLEGVVALVSRYLESEEAAAASPTDRSALLAERGFALGLLDDLVPAADDLRQAIDLDPTRADARAHLGFVLALLGEDDEAIAAVRQARELGPGTVMVAYWAANVIADITGLDEALAELDEAVAQMGPEPVLLALRAKLLGAAGRHEEALEIAEALRDASLAYVDLNRVRGLAFAATNRFESAVEVLPSVVAADPTDTEAATALARSLIALERYAEAVEVLDGVGPDDPAAAAAAALRGLAYTATGDRKAARREFSASLELDGSDPWPRQELVQLAWELGDLEDAERHLGELLADPSVDDEPEVARLAWLLGHPDMALERLDRILADDPENVGGWQLRSGLLVERGDVEGAIGAAARAVELDPSSASRLRLAEAYLAGARAEDALVALGSETGREIEVKRVEIMLVLGQADSALAIVDGLLADEANSQDVEFLVSVVDLLVWGDQQERAASALAPAFASEPRASTLRAAGALLNSIGEFERAVGVLERARALDQYEPGIDQQLSWAYANVPDPPFDAMVAAAERSLRQDPDDPWRIKAKADALLVQGDPEAARFYDSVLERLPSVTTPRDRHSLAAWCYYRKGDFDRAVDHLLHATSISAPRASGDRLDLGLALLVADRPALARREYDQAVDELRAAGMLRRHGLLRVGLVDLDEAIRLRPEVADVPGVDEIRSILVDEIDACRPAFDTLRPLLERADELGHAAVAGGVA